MAKQAAVFGRMVFGQGIDPFVNMAIFTENFRLFFLHVCKAAVIFIMGEFSRGFFRGVEKEGENTGRYYKKPDIYKNSLGFLWGEESHEYTVISDCEVL